MSFLLCTLGIGVWETAGGNNENDRVTIAIDIFRNGELRAGKSVLQLLQKPNYYQLLCLQATGLQYLTRINGGCGMLGELQPSY